MKNVISFSDDARLYDCSGLFQKLDGDNTSYTNFVEVGQARYKNDSI